MTCITLATWWSVNSAKRVNATGTPSSNSPSSTSRSSAPSVQPAQLPRAVSNTSSNTKPPVRRAGSSANLSSAAIWPQSFTSIWSGTWVGHDDGGYRYKFRLHLNVQGEQCDGRFYRTMTATPPGAPLSNRIGDSATEFVHGVFDRQRGQFRLKGDRVDDGTLIATDEYQLTISPASEGRSLVGKSRGNSGNWLHQMQAELVSRRSPSNQSSTAASLQRPIAEGWQISDAATGLSGYANGGGVWFGAVKNLTFSEQERGRTLEVQTKSGKPFRIELWTGYIRRFDHSWWEGHSQAALSTGTGDNPETELDPSLTWSIKPGKYTLFLAHHEPSGRVVRHQLRYKMNVTNTHKR